MSGMTENLFADAASSTERGERVEALKAALNKSIERADARKGRFVIKEGAGQKVIGRSDAEANLAALATQFQGLQKSLDPTQAAEVSEALAQLDAMSKDITAGAYPAVGSPGNLRPYDLEAPAKILVPRFTPILNETARTKGQGGAREYRRILGYTNSGMGGVSDQDIFFNSEATTGLPTFGTLALRRGNKISYSMDVHTVAYVEASVSDTVTYKAQFSNMGFENSRALSHMAMLWAHKLGEEKALLFGRGSTSQGYSGSFNGGTGPSSALTIAAGSAGTASGSTFAGTVTVVGTFRAGVGETLASATQTAATIVATGGITVTLPTVPAGGYGTNLYVNVVTNTAGSPAVGTYFAGFFPASSSGTVTINPANLVNAQSPPTGTDTTSSGGYDGLLTVQTNAALSGWVGAGASYGSGSYTGIGSGATPSGDQFIQDGCEQLYLGVYADPDEVWLNVQQSAALGNYLKKQPSTTATSFRLEVQNDGAIIGANVTGVYNQSSPTRKMLDLRVHPYMPAGCAIIRSRTLDIPDSGVGDTSEVISVQEYMSVDWPDIQFQYDASTYWLGTYVHYAPAWSGAVTGLPAS